jgi:hypothetical protein
MTDVEVCPETLVLCLDDSRELKLVFSHDRKYVKLEGENTWYYILGNDNESKILTISAHLL